jgi:iron complex transport system ATP-binding protein
VEYLFELEDVIVERNRVRILHIDSLQIPLGQNIAIYGPNGSGKSTLLKLWMRFFYPSAVEDSKGCIRILGKSDWNVWDLRSKIGFVSSDIDHHFTHGRSGKLIPKEAVLTGFESSELEIDPTNVTSAMRDAADHWLEFFRIDPRCKKHLAWLSTGERRRVMLARALVFNPAALLLDEPTAGLDLLVRESLLERLEAMTNQGIQVVLVTHHTEEIFSHVNRVVILYGGSLFFDGKVAEAINSDRLSSLYGVPIKVECVRNRYLTHLA